MKLLSFLVVSFSLACVACVNARDEYDNYGSRIPDAAPPVDAMIVSSLPDITGEFYIVARPNLPDDIFLYFRAEFVFTPVTENTGKFDSTIIALDYMTFEEVGDPFVEPDIAVAANATADIPLVGILDGRAQPVTNQTVPLDATIHAELRNADFLCGTLTGTGGALSLDGSTFAAQRITGAELPAAIHRCEDQPAP